MPGGPPAPIERFGGSAMTLDPQDMGANGADTSPHPGEKSEQNTGVSGGARGGTARKARPAHREPLSLFVPWPNPVDGAELLDEIAATFKRHLVLPPGGAETMALWVLFAHTLDAHDCAPRLLLTSPTNGCGKSQAMKLIGHLVDCPYQTASATPSVVYRTIEKCGACYPTLLFDEADNAARDPTKCAILNCGHERFAAFVS